MWRDAIYCERCECDLIYCAVCRRTQHADDKCRHVFQDQDFEWRGAGVNPDDAKVKPAFFRLLDAMPAGFAADLQIAIKSKSFHTWMVAPLIGGGGCLTLYGMPRWRGRNFGDDLIDLGQSEKADMVADGYRWLVSLYNGATRRANRTTVAWIDEWFMGCPE